LKLHLSTPGAAHTFTGYGAGYVAVDGRRFERNLIVLPDRIVDDWSAASFDGLAPEHFTALVELRPEIVLLGTGAHLRFPHPEITRALVEARVGLEVMDVQAACRTYNILAAEARHVAAALLLA
jgi:uncharacterized protein